MYFFRKISLKCTFFDFFSAILKIQTGKSDITPSTAWPLYTLHLQPHGHYTHYTFNRMSIIHNSPSTRWPLYTFHLQPHGRYTIITFEHMAIIHMYPQTDGHYTHVPWGKKALFHTDLIIQSKLCFSKVQKFGQ